MKPKLCFCLDQFIMGGVEKTAMVLLPELKKHYDISLIVESKIKDPYFIEFFKEQEIPVYCTNNEKPKSFLKRKYWKLWGRKHNRNRYKHLFKNADLIIDYKNLWWADFLTNIKTPKISVFHASFPVFQEWGFIEKINSYNKIICLSHSFKKNFVNTYPNYKDKIEHIYNPVNFESIKANSQNTTIKPKEKYFVSVQRLDIEKDVETAIKAFQIFSQEHSDIYLYIVGDGPDREKLEILADNHPQIIFTGQVNNPYSLIKGAEALILSSTKEIGEGLPVTLIEAQALGTLAISSDVQSGPAEILMHGKAGILFPTGNEKALSQILTDVVGEKIDTKSLIQAASKNLNRFDKEQSISKLTHLINSLVTK
ncbi:MAG: glycosyltransferase [Alphaproteobacteria bacterium]|nr:glycosyltransferase [Alphaproteobacteria bacterium]